MGFDVPQLTEQQLSKYNKDKHNIKTKKGQIEFWVLIAWGSSPR